MHHSSLLILASLLLAGCTSAETEAQAKAEIDARDDASCKNHGYQPGTLRYDDCRARIAEQREQADRGALAGRLQGKIPF
jgi:outer membrane biogenesis lipoprotein LolB